MTIVIKICRKCHDELERIISQKEKLEPDLSINDYYRIASDFIGIELAKP